MEAKDLRIGNYVYGQWDKMVKQGRGERTQLYRIQTINPQTAEKYDPIPLTEDWLIKFGFERETQDDRYGRVYRLNDKFIIRRVNFGRPLINDDFGFALEFSDDDNWVTVVKRVFALHQLQNLYFALIGQELELKQTIEVNQ